MAPPSTLTPEVAERIYQALREGLHFKAACGAARVKFETAKSWLAKGKRSDAEPYATFAIEVEFIRAGQQLALLERMRQCADDKQLRDWKQAAFVIERMFPDDFGARINVRVEQAHEALIDALGHEFRDDPAVYERILLVAARVAAGGAEEAGRAAEDEDAEPATH